MNQVGLLHWKITASQQFVGGTTLRPQVPEKNNYYLLCTLGFREQICSLELK